MTRTCCALFSIAMVLVLLGSLAPGALAQERSPPPQEVWWVSTHVKAEVVDNHATVQVIAEITNDGPDPEFPFRVQVPEDALITGLTIERDGVLHEAEIKERETARDQYDQAKREERTAGLVEKQRHASVYAYLVNVEGFEQVTATLTYEIPLSAHRGVYELPLAAPVSGFGRDTGATLEATVTHTDGVVAAWGTPEAGAEETDGVWHVHRSVGPRSDETATPMTLHYSLEPTAPAGTLVATVQDDIGYFAHRLRAEAQAHQLPLDLALVMDTSGSMGGEKIAQLQDAATQVLASLDEEDRIHLTLFSSSPQTPWKGLQHATEDRTGEAIEEIARAYAAGGTNIQDAIREGFAPFEGYNATERLPLVVLLTDGQGSSPADQLRQAAREANGDGAYVFSLAFGRDADWGLVHGLAEDGNGTALWVPAGQGAEVDLRTFMEALTTPVLRDVELTYPDDVTPLATTAPVLFTGSELLVVGTFDPGLSTLTAEVTATGPDGAHSYTVEQQVQTENETPWLPRFVAHHQVRDLQERIQAHGPELAWVEKVTALGLQHGFVTDYTSLVLDLDHNEPDPESRNLTVESSSWGTDGGHGSAPSRSTSGGGSAQPVDADTGGHGMVDPRADQQTQESAQDARGSDGRSDDAQREDHRTGAGELAAETPGPGWLLLVVLVGALSLFVALVRPEA